MATIPQTQTQTTAQFDSALRALATRATARYPGEQARIERGLLLALNGHVTLHDDGAATVRSGSDAEVGYTVKQGTCDCPDFHRAPDGRCKHRWAVSLVRKAQKSLAQRPSTRLAYHATFGTWYGQAIRDEHGRVWFVGDEDDAVYELHQADMVDLHLHGRIDLAADQRRLDLLARTDLSQLDSRKMANL
jgi:hypothetical protein